MKKSDIAMIILIASVSMMVAYFAAMAILGDPKADSVKVKTIDEMSSQVSEPDSRVFGEDAINPTVEIIIGDSESADGV